ncbi:hypothetical protein ACH5RR_014652 [Cinchona calisaya]|uniref:Uncharacterized protein n=1 Tax=Cinchona calisaya TaxID=153742 RepID=A0ABD2ZRB3_9GENT
MVLLNCKSNYIYLNSSSCDKNVADQPNQEASNEHKCGDSNSVKFNGDVKASIDLFIRSGSRGQIRSESIAAWSKNTANQVHKHMAICMFEAGAGKVSGMGDCTGSDTEKRLKDLEKCTMEIEVSQKEIQQTVEGLSKTINALETGILKELRRMTGQGCEGYEDCGDGANPKGKRKSHIPKTPVQGKGHKMQMEFGNPLYPSKFKLVDEDEHSIDVTSPTVRIEAGSSKGICNAKKKFMGDKEMHKKAPVKRTMIVQELDSEMSSTLPNKCNVKRKYFKKTQARTKRNSTRRMSVSKSKTHNVNNNDKTIPLIEYLYCCPFLDTSFDYAYHGALQRN